MAKKKPDNDDSRTEERRRLKSLAFSRGLLSQTHSEPLDAPLLPSKTVLKHQGRDVVKKGQRKNRFLFSFPGFLAPVTGGGGRIGELSDLATGNPILYMEFPQGRMKLFGTIAYPKNRYLTLQFARKNVLCEDSFDCMIVFSDAWWIGRKEENPEEHQLEFPKELIEGKHEDYDFKGGAGDTNGKKFSHSRMVKEQANLLLSDVELPDDISSEDSDHGINDVTLTTPVRQSTRMARKALNYAEHSSEDDSISSDTDRSSEMDGKTISEVLGTTEAKISGKIGNSKLELLDTQASEGRLNNRKCQANEGFIKNSLPGKLPGDKSSNRRGTLVQATLSTLIEKAAGKELKRTRLDCSPKSRGSGSKRPYTSSKQMPSTVQKPRAGKQQKKTQDLEDSDEEWAA